MAVPGVADGPKGGFAQIGARLDPAQLRQLDERVEQGRDPSAPLRAAPVVILPPDGDSAQGALHAVGCPGNRPLVYAMAFPNAERGSARCVISEVRISSMNGEIFYTLQEAKILIEQWRQHYSRFRPHSALDYRPPAPEAIEISPPGFIPLHLAAAQGLTQGAVQ